MSDIRPADSRMPAPKREEGIRPVPTWSHDDTHASADASLPDCDYSLVGQTLRCGRSFSWGALFFALITVVSLIPVVTARNHHYAIFAILPASLSLALYLGRRPAFTCQVTADGLEGMVPDGKIAYAQIHGFYPQGRRTNPDSFPIEVFHEKGYFTIPAGLNESSDRIYRFLVNQNLSLADNRRVVPDLRDYLRLQQSLFASDKVSVFRARPVLDPQNMTRSGIAFCLALTATGIVWVALDRAKTGWTGVGITCALLGGLFTIIVSAVGLQGRRSVFKNWQNACLVLSPGGIGLVQGHLKGELKWVEVLNMTLRKKTAFSVAGNQDSGPGIVLSVAGASVLVADVYDRPIEYIFGLMRRFWSD
jgi:hypothetical protein